MPSIFQTKAARNIIIDGYPKSDRLDSPEALQDYFSGDRIVCLLCGKSYKSLGIHLKTIHSMQPDEYREAYGIPWTYGLVCRETKESYAQCAHNMIEMGLFVPSKEQAERARESLKSQKKRQPVRDVLTNRNLSVMNEGKSGIVTKYRASAPKRGSLEFKEKMRNRPQTKSAPEILGKYWKGREQTDEHVFNRTGFHKKP